MIDSKFLLYSKSLILINRHLEVINLDFISIKVETIWFNKRLLTKIWKTSRMFQKEISPSRKFLLGKVRTVFSLKKEKVFSFVSSNSLSFTSPNLQNLGTQKRVNSETIPVLGKTVYRNYLQKTYL